MEFSHFLHTDLSTLAGDVVAAAILLHRLAALGARLGVGLQGVYGGGEEAACLDVLSV